MIYHHGHILVLAKNAYKRSLLDSNESFVSVMLSANALECYINDFSHLASAEIFSQEISKVRDMAFVLGQLESSRSTLIAKIASIHYFLSGKEPDKGTVMFQDLQFLIRLRNELIHRKPEDFGTWGGAFDESHKPHSLVQYLSGRKVIAKPDSNDPPVWGQYLNRPEVARWAYNIVTGIIGDIVEKLPPSHLKSVQISMIKDRKKI